LTQGTTQSLIGVALSRSLAIVVTVTVFLGVTAQPAAAAASPANQTESRLPAAIFSQPPKDSGTLFGGTSIDLRAKGYVEEEFFASGTANRYRMKDPLKTAQIVDGEHQYITRILVRRPTDPKRFNGRVLVEWFNVSGSQDAEFVFGAVRNHVLEEGYAWVGVSAQLVGVNALKTSNPKRYGQLSLTASNDDPLGGQLDERSDVLSWDVYTQVANALRNPPGGIDPLGGLRPTLYLAVGESQSAQRLSQYYNAVLPLYKHTFDGFLLYDRLLGGMRTDLGTKMLTFGSEIIRQSFGAAPADNTNLRVWEVAGAGHLSYDETAGYWDEQFIRNGVLRALDGHAISLSQTFIGCDNYPLWSRVPNEHVLAAGLEALAKWVTVGTPPATAERLRGDDNGKLYRDSLGRVSGGIRLAAYDAPISMNTGGNSGPGFACALGGSHQDYSPGQLRQLYGTPENYVAKVTAITQKAVRDGFILEADAARTIKEAGAVKF
jgi:hypothetical protein